MKWFNKKNFSYEAQQRFGVYAVIFIGAYLVYFRWDDWVDSRWRYPMLIFVTLALFELAFKAVKALVAYVFRDRDS
jgi:hypothetical protein